MKYELHNDLDADFPVIFGFRTLSASHPDDAYLHWHDCIELIYCVYGHGQVIASADRISIQEGDIVIINSGKIHDIFTNSECGVYSLDMESSLYTPLGLETKRLVFENKIKNPQIETSIKRIIEEMALKNVYYKQAVHIEIISIVINLMRDHLDKKAGQCSIEDQQVQTVKKTISYLQEHYLEHITMDGLCESINYNKFYLCHSFKKTTGVTIVQYINFLRCQHARSLLLSGNYKVSESAAMSGFENDSYFTRTYKSVFGRLPSNELAKKPHSR